MGFLLAILSCLAGPDTGPSYSNNKKITHVSEEERATNISEKTRLLAPQPSTRTTQIGRKVEPHPKPYDGQSTLTSAEEIELAETVLKTLISARRPGKELRKELNSIVRPYGWYDGLAKRLLQGLIQVLKSGASLGNAVQNTFNAVVGVATQFVDEHPILASALLTLTALGILVVLMPWVIEALGFGELGPVEGSFAAWWQSTLPNAEAGSVFSYLQRLGMKWGKA